MWVSYVNGTPKMSQIGSLIYGITQLANFSAGWKLVFAIKCQIFMILTLSPEL